jgi:hypothetical protein
MKAVLCPPCYITPGLRYEPNSAIAWQTEDLAMRRRTLEIIEGKLPNRALALVLEWAAQHRGALMEDWKLCEAMQRPNRIQPLD